MQSTFIQAPCRRPSTHDRRFLFCWLALLSCFLRLKFPRTNGLARFLCRRHSALVVVTARSGRFGYWSMALRSGYRRRYLYAISMPAVAITTASYCSSLEPVPPWHRRRRRCDTRRVSLVDTVSARTAPRHALRRQNRRPDGETAVLVGDRRGGPPSQLESWAPATVPTRHGWEGLLW